MTSHHPQRLRPAERDVRVEAELLVLHQREPREPARQLGERQLRLELSEARAQAEVDALAEGQVAAGVGAVEVEGVGLGEDRGVAARGGQPEEELGARGQLDAAHARGLRRHPPPHADRGVEAQRLLDGARDRRRIGDDARPARRVLEQPPHEVADEVVRRLVAGEAQREQDRGDLLEREAPRGPRRGCRSARSRGRRRGARRARPPARAGSRGRRRCSRRARPAPPAVGARRPARRGSRTSA